MWREKVTSASSHIFPGLNNYDIPKEDHYVKIGFRALSNLPLQVSLYFNLVFFPFWLLVEIVMIPLKFWQLSNLYQFILVLSFGAVVIIECIRLFMGYKGNLKEKIPELAAFWLMTVLLQAPLQMFLLVSTGLKSSLLEIIMQTLMCTFLLSQLILGFVALRHSAKHSILSFHSSNFHIPEEEN